MGQNLLTYKDIKIVPDFIGVVTRKVDLIRTDFDKMPKMGGRSTWSRNPPVGTDKLTPPLLSQLQTNLNASLIYLCLPNCFIYTAHRSIRILR